MMKLKTHRSKRLIYTVISIWIISIFIWFNYNYNYNHFTQNYTTPYSIYNIYDNFNIIHNDKDSNTESNITYFKDSLAYNYFKSNLTLDIKDETYSQIYDTILENHQFESILNLDFHQRCDLFFKNVFIEDQNWIFNPNENFPISYYSKEYSNFLLKHGPDLKSQFSKNHQFETQRDYEYKLSTYLKKQYHDWSIEQKLINHLTLIRNYNRCFINTDKENEKINHQFIINQQKYQNKPSFEPTNHEQLINLNQAKVVDFEYRVYPWLSFEMPIFERWTGELFYSPPKMKNILNDKIQPSASAHTKSTSFLQNFKHQCNGKGIVLSIADKHVDHTVNLIHLLRALNNKLPIQIVYFDNISNESKQKVVTAAREDFSHLPQSFYKIQDKFPSNYLDPASNGLPKQEIWFINVANAIQDNFKFKFRGFSNKILATLFNSFNEFMLIDADTVMMQNPEFFFTLDGYKETGTYFFKDRGVLQKRDIRDGEFLKKIGPSVIDNLMFNVPLMTNYTIQRDLFRGLIHYMESGLVVLNKQTHFNSILMMQNINFFPPITSKVYGDKEIFWLGFAINGDENYHFNKYNAASIGEITSDQERMESNNGKLSNAKELCSPHPGHINGEDGLTLLWINSGFRYCHQADQINFNTEAGYNRRLKTLKTVDQFKTFYYNPLRIKQALIPPIPQDLKDRNNDENEPSSGWAMDHQYCARYLWCAYSSVGGKSKSGEDNTLHGRYIEFSEFEQDLFNYYGDIWVGLE